MSPTASPPKPSPARESSNEFGSASEFDSSKVSVVASGELPTAESDGKRPKRLIVASLVSVLMLSIVGYSMVASGTAATEQEESASNESLLPVRVLVVGSVRPPGLGREYAGLLIPDRESVLSFEGDGRIASINVEEGDLIRTGDVIAVLDQSHLDAKQRRIESELAAANARLDELVSGPRKQTVAAARAKVDELVARVELAKVEARRQEQLVPRGATSRSERDAAVFGLEAQEKELLAARSALEQLAEGTRAEQLAEQRARCQAIEASLEEVAAERDDATIIAPFSGRIEQRFVDEGTVVSSGIQVVKLVSQLVEAEVGLPPSVASNLTTGERVTLRLRGQDRDAWIDRLEPTVRSQTRTRVVFVSLINPADPTQPEENGALNAWVAGEVIGLLGADKNQTSGESQFWLPSDSLVRGTRGLWNVIAVVDSQDAGKAVCENRAVELLRTDGPYVLVRGMLESGERVIAEGLHRVTAGMQVDVIVSSEEAKS